jgi:hypothetical protein
MRKLLTVITAYAGYHDHLVERAAATVAAQTLPCDFIALKDYEMMGPGYKRNEGVRLAKTPFVTFLDADDLLEPDFAEKMLAYYQPGHYVYCDFFMGKEAVKTCDCTDLWNYLDHGNQRCEAHNVVTSVMHKSIFEKVGGFPEKRLMTMEDTYFWLTCISKGICGIRCPYPLMTYTRDGQRSAEVRSSPYWATALRRIYEEIPRMGCRGCNGTPPADDTPRGARQPNDVLVYSLWQGNQSFTGRKTGRVYPKYGYGMTGWVDPRDVEAAPERYKLVDLVDPEPVEPEIAELKAGLTDFAAMTKDELESYILEHDIDTAKLAGTGKDGAVLKADLVKFLSEAR